MSDYKRTLTSRHHISNVPKKHVKKSQSSKSLDQDQQKSSSQEKKQKKQISQPKQQKLPQEFLCDFHNQVQTMVVGAQQYSGQLDKSIDYAIDSFKDVHKIHCNKINNFESMLSQASQKNRKQEYRGVTKNKLLNKIKQFLDRQYQLSILFLIGHGTKGALAKQAYFLWFQDKNPIPHFIYFEDIVSLWQISKVRYLLICACFCYASNWQSKLLKLPQKYSISMMSSHSNQDDKNNDYIHTRLFQIGEGNIIEGRILFFVAYFCNKYFQVVKKSKFNPDNQIKDEKIVQNVNNTKILNMIQGLNQKTKYHVQINVNRQKLVGLKFKDQKGQVKSYYSGFDRDEEQKNRGALFHRIPFMYNGKMQNGFFYQGGFFKNIMNGLARYTPNTSQQKGVFSKYSEYIKGQQIKGNWTNRQTKKLQKHYNSQIKGQTLDTWKQYLNINGQTWTFNQFAHGKALIQTQRKVQGLQLQFYINKGKHFMQVNFYSKLSKQNSNKQNLVLFCLKEGKVFFCIKSFVTKFHNYRFRHQQEKKFNKNLIKKFINESLKYKLSIFYAQNGQIKIQYSPITSKPIIWDINIHRIFGKNNCLQRILIPNYTYSFEVYKTEQKFVSIKQTIPSEILKHRHQIAIDVQKCIKDKDYPKEQKWLDQKLIQINKENNKLKMIKIKKQEKKTDSFIVDKSYFQSIFLKIPN